MTVMIVYRKSNQWQHQSCQTMGGITQPIVILTMERGCWQYVHRLTLISHSKWKRRSWAPPIVKGNTHGVRSGLSRGVRSWLARVKRVRPMPFETRATIYICVHSQRDTHPHIAKLPSLSLKGVANARRSHLLSLTPHYLFETRNIMSKTWAGVEVACHKRKWYSLRKTNPLSLCHPSTESLVSTFTLSLRNSPTICIKTLK